MTPIPLLKASSSTLLRHDRLLHPSLFYSNDLSFPATLAPKTRERSPHTLTLQRLPSVEPTHSDAVGSTTCDWGEISRQSCWLCSGDKVTGK